jgi:antitoxin component YwqK of YwqJK toxin-antitoxin module
MKHFIILLLFFFFACNAADNRNEQGFTNKAEAKNQMVNGLKEGKWVEHMDTNYDIVPDTNAPNYALTIYKAGKAFGISRGYYKSGKLLSETPYVDGKINGLEKGYYENGSLMYESPMINGKTNGVYKEYYLNGKLEMEGLYSNDSLHIIKDYNENGILERITPYTFSNKDSCRIDGVQKSYYEDGKVREEVTYNNSKIIGISKEYYESGKLKSEVHWIDGKVSGDRKNYYESGKLLSETPCIYNQEEDYVMPNGVSKEYYENGKLKSIITYVNDDVVATIKYNENGALTEGKVKEYIDSDFETTQDSTAPYYKITNYHAGMPYGIEKSYYKNGNLESEVPYTKGKINGVVKEYYESGKIEYERPYQNGVKIGTEKRYYESGVLARETVFNKDDEGITKTYDSTGHQIK